MVSRRDQLQSYQFLMYRVISALVMRETDPAESPLRRGVGAVFAGFMISVIVAAGFGVFGLITQLGAKKWQFDGAVVVEKETGAVYLYEGGTLHPMANYASALLASGHTPPTTASVSRNSLVHIPRGNVLGIPNAPTALPDNGKVLAGGWRACAVPGTDNAGNTITSTVLLVSGAPAGARALPDEQAVLVRNSGQGASLVYHGYRYQLRGDVLSILYGNSPLVPVDNAWLNTVPEGRPIDQVKISGPGARSGALPNHTNGDLLMTRSASGPQYYLVLNDGLAAITELQKDVYVGETGTSPEEIPIREATDAKKSSALRQPDGDAAPPRTAPKLAPVTTSRDLVCVDSGDARQSRLAVSLGGTLPTGTDGIATGQANGSVQLADRIVVPPGQVAVIKVLASPSATFGSYCLVTDTGLRYPVVAPAVLGMLGYDPAKAVEMPAEFANLVPAGPTLDPERALRAVDIAGITGG